MSSTDDNVYLYTPRWNLSCFTFNIFSGAIISKHSRWHKLSRICWNYTNSNRSVSQRTQMIISLIEPHNRWTELSLRNCHSIYKLQLITQTSLISVHNPLTTDQKKHKKKCTSIQKHFHLWHVFFCRIPTFAKKTPMTSEAL